MPDWLISFATHPATLLTIGGGAGANARYWLGKLVVRVQGETVFPWATLIVNIAGSVLLGFIAAAYLNHPEPSRRNWYLLLGTGFCGAFTTFSTFSYETMKLVQNGNPWAVPYIVASVALCLAGVWIAMNLAENRGGM
jgi:CrcB protein